jgi:hypothetical protein
MKRIYKYSLPVSLIAELEVPVGSKFMHIDAQYADICVWYEVDDDEKETRMDIYHVVMTGDAVPPKSSTDDGGKTMVTEYLKTVLVNEGSFVAHVYTNKYTDEAGTTLSART